MTLDKYFGSSFKVVDANYQFSKDFGENYHKSGNNDSIQQYLEGFLLN